MCQQARLAKARTALHRLSPQYSDGVPRAQLCEEMNHLGIADPESVISALIERGDIREPTNGRYTIATATETADRVGLWWTS